MSPESKASFSTDYVHSFWEQIDWTANRRKQIRLRKRKCSADYFSQRNQNFWKAVRVFLELVRLCIDWVCILRKTYYGTCILRNMCYGLWIGKKLIERNILRDCSSWQKYWVWKPCESVWAFFFLSNFMGEQNYKIWTQ